ncbi:MAG: S4 domain-containing protein [Gaiellales bacterium]
MESVRIDKWLWAARFFKTRAAATEAVLGGRVRLNGDRVKPAKDVRSADVVEVRVGEVTRTIAVRGVRDERGSARAAATLYEETAESVAERARAADERKLSRPLGADLAGPRPTKQDRRRIEALRRGRRGSG